MEHADAESARSPPEQHESAPKKPKISPAAGGEDAGPDATADGVEKKRFKRRKIAIFLAYSGVGYQGMQKNPGAKTIEGELEEALYLSGAISENDRGNPRRYDWARSARTDKGVSAVGQVVSGKFYIDPPGLLERLNSNLPDQIRIFGYKRVTASFNAKKFCDRRRYVYLIPVFALDPSCHCIMESELASEDSVIDLSKCLECSEKGRKILSVRDRQNPEPLSETNEDIVFSPGDDGHESLKAESDIVGSHSDISSSSGSTIMESELKRDVGDEKPVKQSGFSYGDKEKERFNRILNRYVGTHNFHNFTSRTKAEDPSATRYIVSFAANTTLTAEGIEFVKCEVVGQSFMLHQIRKMIGLAVAVMRNCAPESIIETALKKDVNINVPMAPEVGLYLDECIYAAYNKRWKASHEQLSMEAYEQEAEDFKKKHIHTYIASTEHKEGIVAIWLHYLNRRSYQDLRVGDAEKTTVSEVKDVDAGEATESQVKGVDGGETTQSEEVKDVFATEAGEFTEKKSAEVEKME